MAPFSALTSPRVITFTGGMGAQIISTAAYHALREAGEPVLADLRYFEHPPHLAQAETPGDCSHWPWQLDDFGISQQSFVAGDASRVPRSKRIEDGALKLSLGIQALRQHGIQARFTVPPKVDDLLPAGFPESYLCLHIRRGDYVNVASHLVANEQFTDMARNFSGLLKGAVVISDSPIPQDFRAVMAPLFPQVVWADTLNAFSAHRLMRHARILVCSNSQFSLIAALLNPCGMVVLPRRWFGAGHEDMEHTLLQTCDFQILSRLSD